MPSGLKLGLFFALSLGYKDIDRKCLGDKYLRVKLAPKLSRNHSASLILDPTNWPSITTPFPSFQPPTKISIGKTLVPMLLKVYCFVSYMRKKETPTQFVFRGSLGMFGTMPRYTCHTTGKKAEGTFHAQRKYHRKATRKVFPGSCNFNLREPQHTPGAYPTPPQTPKWKEFLHKLLVLGLGYVPGVCWQILGFKHQTNPRSPKFSMLSQNVTNVGGLFFLITDPWKNTNEQWWTQNGHDHLSKKRLQVSKESD